MRNYKGREHAPDIFPPYTPYIHHVNNNFCFMIKADLMESLVKNSTSASETAIAAANSYKNIVAEIQKSLNAAINASTAAEETIDKVYIMCLIV